LVATFPFYHIDVFTQVPYQGNPASVLVGSTAFADRQMQTIAREIGLPGNGFVWPAAGEGQAFHSRFFTPQQEVSLSGHTSLACAHAILSTMSSEELPATVTLRTRTAVLTVQRQATRLWLTLPLPSLRSYAGAVRDLATVLRLTGRDIRQDLPLQLSPENDLLIPLGDGVEITQVVPDLQAMATLGRREGLRGVCVFTTRTRDPTVQVHSRFFAPHYGVPEDAATGSVHGSLAVYLWRYGLVQPRGSLVALVGKQGEVLGRSSRVHVEVLLKGGTPQQVRVGGEAVTVMSGTLEPPL
jgi:trans-2,3-dihydro-3-hydroxyanthranilate isomerase